jgi:hypothetical protein
MYIENINLRAKVLDVDLLNGLYMMKNDKKKKAAKLKLKKRRKSSTKGALIKGVSRMLPIEVIDSKIFEEDLPKLMRRYAGVYILYDKKKVHYVGLSKNLLSRLKNHLKDKHKGRWDRFTVFRIAAVQYLKDLETLLQYVTLPAGNVVEGKLPKDANFNKILMDVLKEQGELINKLKKGMGS